MTTPRASRTPPALSDPAKKPARVRTGIAHPGNQPKTITGGFMFARLRYLLDFTAWALTIAFVPFLGVVIYLAGGGR